MMLATPIRGKYPSHYHPPQCGDDCKDYKIINSSGNTAKNMCLYPKIIENRKYKVNKKNGGVIPPIFDERTRYVPVGCGKCMECMKQKQRNWQIRLLEDIREHKNGKFITLTFNRESLEKLQDEVGYINDKYVQDNAVATLAVRRFLERWRKKYKKSIRHWLVTELGHTGTERIHIHGIIYTDEDNITIEDIWKYGFIWIGSYVNERTINYITKYISKQDLVHKNYIPKILTSSGIGSRYLKTETKKLNKYEEGKTREYYRTRTGHKINLPVYYRNNIYSEEEREKLWIEKLDKNERFVCGEKVSTENGEESYEEIREWYRGKNERLGYGDDKINWDERQYKNQLKKLKIKEKIRKEKIKSIHLGKS